MMLAPLSLFLLTFLQLPSSLLTYHISRSSDWKSPRRHVEQRLNNWNSHRRQAEQRLNDEFTPFRDPSPQAAPDFPSPPMKIRMRPSPPMKIRIRMPQHTNVPLPPLPEDILPMKPFVPLPSLLRTLRENYPQPPQVPLQFPPPPPSFRRRQIPQMRLPRPFVPPPIIFKDVIPLPFPPPPPMGYFPRHAPLTFPPVPLPFPPVPLTFPPVPLTFPPVPLTFPPVPLKFPPVPLPFPPVPLTFPPVPLTFPPVPTARGERLPFLPQNLISIFPTPGPRGFFPRQLRFPFLPPLAGPPLISNDFAEIFPRIPFQLNDDIILPPPQPQFQRQPMRPPYRPFPWQMRKQAELVLRENPPFIPFTPPPPPPFVDAPPRMPMQFPDIVPGNLSPPPFFNNIHQLSQGGSPRPLPRLLMRSFP